MKKIGKAENSKFSLEVFECDCKFHIGIDTTFLSQVRKEIKIICPSCGDELLWLETEEYNKRYNKADKAKKGKTNAKKR